MIEICMLLPTFPKPSLFSPLQKVKMADMERTIQQKAAAVEEKYRINIASLTEENNTLRWGKKSSKIRNSKSFENV